MYHVAVPSLVQRVQHDIIQQNLLQAGDCVGIAVSSGADSVALLRLLLELRADLGLVLSVVHLNHGLRGAASDADEQFAAELARNHSLEFLRAADDVSARPEAKTHGIEAAARAARYEFFWRLLEEKPARVNKIATAHTLDDQAETVLLRLARGAGSKGLAGIYPRLTHPRMMREHPQPAIVRPLLHFQRAEIEAWLNSIGQPWREDASNRDLRFARNRVRHGLLPRLEEHLNPNIRQALAETAEIARAEEEYWQAQVGPLLAQVQRGAPSSLARNLLLAQPLALRRRLVRAAAAQLGLQLEFKHVEAALAVAAGRDSAHACALPAGWEARRVGDDLRLVRAPTAPPLDYEERLAAPGRVHLAALNSLLQVSRIATAPPAVYNPDHLYSGLALAKELVVRNWRPGDRFWPAHSKAPKKIKDLLQERKIPPAERKLWPVVVRDGEVVWLRGFPAPAHLRPAPADPDAWLIQELFPAAEIEPE
jgi:tRNA(Ile)-lysidine synthase